MIQLASIVISKKIPDQDSRYLFLQNKDYVFAWENRNLIGVLSLELEYTPASNLTVHSSLVINFCRSYFSLHLSLWSTFLLNCHCGAHPVPSSCYSCNMRHTIWGLPPRVACAWSRPQEVQFEIPLPTQIIPPTNSI